MSENTSPYGKKKPWLELELGKVHFIKDANVIENRLRESDKNGPLKEFCADCQAIRKEQRPNIRKQLLQHIRRCFLESTNAMTNLRDCDDKSSRSTTIRLAKGDNKTKRACALLKRFQIAIDEKTKKECVGALFEIGIVIERAELDRLKIEFTDNTWQTLLQDSGIEESIAQEVPKFRRMIEDNKL